MNTPRAAGRRAQSAGLRRVTWGRVSASQVLAWSLRCTGPRTLTCTSGQVWAKFLKEVVLSFTLEETSAGAESLRFSYLSVT